MSLNLDNLSKNDWDILFPIMLVPFNKNWRTLFAEERDTISNKLGDKIIRIEHFGSTSISGMSSKPYIDLLIEIKKELLFDETVIERLEDLGYHHFRQTGNVADYMIFVKGYKLDGEEEQIYHIHMCPKENELWDQIIFRDYLRGNKKRAQQYEKLKLDLAVKFKNDRSGYRIAKSDFINETLALAKMN